MKQAPPLRSYEVCSYTRRKFGYVRLCRAEHLFVYEAEVTLWNPRQDGVSTLVQVSPAKSDRCSFTFPQTYVASGGFVAHNLDFKLIVDVPKMINQSSGWIRECAGAS